jgi:arylsulfatase K
VVFTTDHGTLLGEQEQFAKGPERLRGQITHVPLLIRTPGKQHASKRVSGFIQHPDLMPAFLNLLGLKPPSRVTGSNFWPLITGEAKSLHDYVVQAYGWIAAVRTREWNYSQIWQPAAPQLPFPPQLYDLEKDPQELTSVAGKYPEITRQLSARLQEYIASGEEITRGSFHAKESLGMGTVYVNTKTRK